MKEKTKKDLEGVFGFLGLLSWIIAIGFIFSLASVAINEHFSIQIFLIGNTALFFCFWVVSALLTTALFPSRSKKK